MTTHNLKIHEKYYDKLTRGEKKCEIRYNDRDFQKWDILDFSIIYEEADTPIPEWYYWHIPEWYYWQKFKITHVLYFPDGLKDWYVALSLSKTK